MGRPASWWSVRAVPCGACCVLALSLSGCGAGGVAGSETAAHTRTSHTRATPEDATPAESPPAAFDELVALARERVSRPDAPATIPAELTRMLGGLDYDQHREIRYRPDRSLWRNEPGRFEVQLFHLGHRALTPLTVSVIDSDRTARLDYDRTLFEYRQGELPVDPSLGYAGLRVHTWLNNDAYRDEVLVFHGASYFRSLARGQVYGLSARGLAIDTGEATPEEFPRFSELRLVRPGPSDTHLWVLGLLESTRATGAYAFRVAPGAPTRIEVTARVFFRELPGVVGVAPITSMYLFGEERPARFGDYRPEVHDSDTLVIHAEGEQIARPLRNPPRTTTTLHQVAALRGFGLEQRDRAPASYEDAEMRYERRPTAWVEPLEPWGPGAVRLFEMHTELETDDNIGVMWVPAEIPADGLSLRYRITFGEQVPWVGEGAHVVANRVAAPGQFPDRALRFIVDLQGPRVARPFDVEGATWVLEARGAEVVQASVAPHPVLDGVRVTGVVRLPERPGDVELRGYLTKAGEALSETWSYLWQPTE